MTSRRRGHRGSKAAWLEFVGLTVVVMAAGLSLGLLARHLAGESTGEPLNLMRLAEAERTALPQHRIVDAYGPTVPFIYEEEPPTSPVEPLAAIEQVVSGVAQTAEAVEANEPEPASPQQQAPAASTRSTQAAGGSGEIMMFNGRPLRKVRDIRMKVTAYSPDERSCGIWADGVTASGMSVWTNGMRLAAADTRVLPFRSIITVPGYNGGDPIPVLDRGGAIKGNRLDVLYPTHEIARRWGVQDLNVTVWEYAD